MDRTLDEFQYLLQVPLAMIVWFDDALQNEALDALVAMGED